ncbi:hypothetical protein TNCV_4541881 [Trichonephila clavipes]|nr:hypothetical protein TNCV_4541881 [Trichonephila clavipes]
MVLEGTGSVVKVLPVSGQRPMRQLALRVRVPNFHVAQEAPGESGARRRRRPLETPVDITNGRFSVTVSRFGQGLTIKYSEANFEASVAFHRCNSCSSGNTTYKRPGGRSSSAPTYQVKKMRDQAYRICRDYLSGSWKSISSSDMVFRSIRVHQGRIDYLILGSVIVLELSLGESVIDSGPG